MGMPAVVEPTLIVESFRIHNKRVTVPLSDRVPYPGGGHFLWKASPVGKNLPKAVLVFVEDRNLSGRLKYFERCSGHHHCVRYTVGQTTLRRPTLGVGFLPFFVKRSSPGRERN